MKVFIRHAEKEYDNGKSTMYPLDPGLTKDGKEKAYSHFENLVNQIGPPSLIISSPYLRTRETADQLLLVLKEKGISCQIEYDVELGEYLGHQCKKYANKDFSFMFREETLRHGNPLFECDFSQFEQRVRKRLAQDDGENVWYITHGIIVEEKMTKLQRSKYLETVITRY